VPGTFIEGRKFGSAMDLRQLRPVPDTCRPVHGTSRHVPGTLSAAARITTRAPPPKRAAAAPSAQATPSAERSEARAGCVRRRHLCRVASPLVMAASNAGWAFRLQAWRTACVRGRHYPCFAGDSATRYDWRLQRQALRLRCAPSSWALQAAPKHQSEPPQRRALNSREPPQRLRSQPVFLPPKRAAAAAPITTRIPPAKASRRSGFDHDPCSSRQSEPPQRLRSQPVFLPPKRAAAAASAQLSSWNRSASLSASELS